MKIALSIFCVFAFFSLVAAAKVNKREASKDPVPEKTNKNKKNEEKLAEKFVENEEKVAKKNQIPKDPVDKILVKQQRKLEKINRESEMARAAAQAPVHAAPEIQQDPQDQQPKLKVKIPKAPKVILSPEQYENFLKEKAAEKVEKQSMKRQKLLLKAEQMINEIEMLDVLECQRNSQAENFGHLVNGGPEKDGDAKCREPSEVLRSLKERVENLRIKEEQKRFGNQPEPEVEKTNEKKNHFPAESKFD